MDLCDVSAGKYDHRRASLLGLERPHEDHDTKSLRLPERLFQVVDFIARGFTAVGIWQVTVRDHHQHLAVLGLYADLSVALSWSPDLHTLRMSVIRHHLTVSEREKPALNARTVSAGR